MFSIKQLSITTIGTIAIGLGSVAPVNAASLYEVIGLDFTPADINNSSQIVGGQYLWSDGNVTDLSTLPGGDGNEDFFIDAVAINNNGAIVGESYWSNPNSREFVSNGSTISPLLDLRDNSFLKEILK